MNNKYLTLKRHFMKKILRKLYGLVIMRQQIIGKEDTIEK